MKKIYLILVLVLASYGFSSDVEVTTKSVGKTNIVSVCVFPTDTAKKGYLFLYVTQNGFQQVMESNAGNIPRVASCERKTK